MLVAGCMRSDSREAESCSRTGARSCKQRTGLKQTQGMVVRMAPTLLWHMREYMDTKNCCVPGSMPCSFSENALPTSKFTCEVSAFTWSKRPPTHTHTPACFLSMAAPCKRWGRVYDLLLEDSRIGVQEQVTEKWSVRAIERWGTLSYQGCQKLAGTGNKDSTGWGRGCCMHTALPHQGCCPPQATQKLSGHGLWYLASWILAIVKKVPKLVWGC